MVRSFGRPSCVRVKFGFIPFALASFTLTVHINALYNESIHGKEEHATGINMIPLKISHLLRLLCRTDEVNATRVFTLG